MKRYEKYKNSGVDWIGEIPEEWEQKPFSSIFKVQSVINNIDAELLSVYLEQGVIKFSDVKEKRTNVTSEDLSKYQLVNVGDFVMNNQQAWRGSVGISNHEGIVSPAYIVLKPDLTLNSTYLNYLLRNRSFVSHYLICSKGVGTIQRNLYWPQLKRVYLFYPPLSEQQSIALFLDEKTAKIDQTISIKEKEILLLKERRQILIQKAVTKGLNPNVKLKNSGVDWIGEIPEHWEVLPGFNVYKENKTNNIGMKEKVVLSLSYGNIVIKPEEKLVGLVPESFETYQIVKPGDIIIRCMDLQNDKTSLRTGIAVNDGIITNAYLNLNIINGNNSNYYYNFLHTLDTTKVIYKFGKGLRQNLSYVDFKRMQIIVPPKIEQNEIANHIEKLKIKISKAISLKQQEIEKLKEYKTVLVDNVVTGKVKIF